jgi:hypothetical protein
VQIWSTHTRGFVVPHKSSLRALKRVSVTGTIKASEIMTDLLRGPLPHA